MKTSRLISGVCCATLLCVCAETAWSVEDFRVGVGDMHDQRSSVAAESKLTLNLLMHSEVFFDAEAWRVQVETATDESGKNLVVEPDEPIEYSLRSSMHRMPDVPREREEFELVLASPTRNAVRLQELSGVVDIYVPRRDPDSIIVVTPLGVNTTGEKLSFLGLTDAGIELRLFGSAEAKAILEEQENEMKEAMEQLSGEEAAVAQAFMSLFGVGSRVPEHAIAVRIQGETERLLDLQFTDRGGSKLTKGWTMTSGDMQVHTFDDAVPHDAVLTIYLRTETATVQAPFTLKGVPLP